MRHPQEHGPHGHDHDLRAVDLELWDIGHRARACIVSVAARTPQPPIASREALASVASLQHVTVEVPPLPAAPSSAMAP